jgi:hypothetical protein
MYSTFTPGDGLRYDAETEVTPLMAIGQPGSSAVGVDWTDGQRLVPGWMVARVPIHLATRRVTSRRERLLVERVGDRLEVQNGFGTPLEALALADAARNLFEASRLAAGARGTLAPIAGRGAVVEAEAGTLDGGGPRDLAAELLEKGLAEAVRGATERPERYVRPGTYVALLAGDPFSEEALPDAVTVAARAVVLGSLGADAP